MADRVLDTGRGRANVGEATLHRTQRGLHTTVHVEIGCSAVLDGVLAVVAFSDSTSDRAFWKAKVTDRSSWCVPERPSPMDRSYSSRFASRVDPARIAGLRR